MVEAFTSVSRCSASLWRKRWIVAPCPRATFAPSYMVLCALSSRNITPPPTRTGMTDMWMCVIVGRSSASSEPSNVLVVSSSSS